MDLATNYLGLRLKNPLVVGAGPTGRSVDTLRRCEQAGAAAVVLPSLFQEEIEHDLAADLHFEQFGAESYPEALSYRPDRDYTPRKADEYCRHVSHVKDSLDVPVIASLNGTNLGDWTDHAKRLQNAGADALELNIYYLATDPSQSAKDVEDRYVEILDAVKEAVRIPVTVKLGPYFTSLANFARRLDARGVDGLVLFNRFYQPDIDLESLEVVPDLVLSAPHEMRLPLRWIAILDTLVEASLAATTGVYTTHDVLKLLMVGADAVMLNAALLRHGPGIIGSLLHDIEEWLYINEYLSVHQLQGSMNHKACPDPAAFERANYLKALQNYA